ncbi:type 2 periplasmic-binding domain-containing protein [Cohnella rhizosphaerae]|uniref:Extracellular solute-binding protein n=1 Tax=Cohnella rhizosphaerae TaxID=1457232 RepID=A0A9X4QU05_9BACL|nr:extracellular solute-binding protein [Cohnella rhizosphaerae]MDG0809967.1 extracellular solute-binding protein [Cohnella rhizosphaerae]
MATKTKKRAVAVILLVTMLAALMAACSGKNENGGASASGSAGAKGSESAKPSATAEPPVTLDWLAYNSYGQPDANAPLVQMVEKKFNAKFNVWYVDNQKWVDQLNVKFAAGEMPDVLQIREQIPKYVDNGILAPIPEEKIRELAPTYAATIDKYDPNLWNAVKYDGKIYGLPSINLAGDYPTVVLWRQDWLDNVGITKIPETLDEFEAALLKFRNDDPDKDGKKDTYGLSSFAIPFVMGAFGYPGNNASYVMKDGKITFAAIQPEMKDALTVLNKWYKEELIDPEFVTGENTGGYWADSQALYNGRIGLTGNGMFYQWRNELFGGEDQGGGQYQNFIKAQPGGKLTFGKPPVGPSGKSGTLQWGVNSTAVGITNKAAEDPRKLETLLKMLETTFTDYDYYMTVLRGNEGEDWKKVDDSGKVLILNQSTSVADFSKKGVQVFNIMNNPDFDKKADADLYKFADSKKTTGYPPVIAPAVDSYAKYAGDLYKLATETYIKIILGEQPVSSFDAFVAKFKANGGDEIEKDVNEAYNKMLGK